jgi:NADPH-dependent curcumin reductase
VENRRLVLAERPNGLVSSSTVALTSAERSGVGPGEALIKVGTLSIDPTIRTWMNDAPGYLPPIQVGEVIRGGGAGVVTESRHEHLAVGDVVFGMTGWQEWCVAGPDALFNPIPKGLGLDLATVLNVLGVTGITAYFGLLDVGAFTPADTVVVSAATGATGSVAGQLARARGAKRVVGIAGGPAKCDEAVSFYGYDACCDYRSGDLATQLRNACPDGVDLYFDNVGGDVLDAVLTRLNLRGRVVLCGAIAQYNDTEPASGLKNHANLIINRGRMEGFIVLDYLARFTEAQFALAEMVLAGTLKHQEHLVHGLEKAPEALNLLFSGGNRGKTLVVVDPDVVLT